MEGTLFELTGEYLEILALAEDPDTDPEVLQGSLESIEAAIEVKADGYADVIDNLKIVIGGINGEIEAIDRVKQAKQAKVDAIENHITRMKSHLGESLKATGNEKLKTDRHSFFFKRNESVEVDDPEGLPEELVRVKREPKKTEIKAAIKRGELKGVAHLNESESLQIR